jgi:hypothetical protein
MSAHQINHSIDRSSAAKVNVLGLLLFLMGAPHIYEIFKRQAVMTRSANLLTVNRLILIAAVLAALIEIYTLA